ncbi:MAG: molybdopterin-synthase adenylyltransferase MoeB [Candidatus Kapabacteria bacterium]|nr:molybdopterin-synthase adenylyltransferase MoeB [Candidatus Kapabacteria bacterium]
MNNTHFTNQERDRYSRHLLLPEVGFEGQQRLKEAKILVIGAGGLGSPAALYLAAAGIGTLGIADGDVVELSNLQRQILHSTQNIGKSKVSSAVEHIHALNPLVRVIPHTMALTRDNALAIIADYDVVVDGTDNFATRYLVNDASGLLGKPLVYGSVFRFTGQVSVFDAAKGGCYRCLYPEPPPPHLVPNCAEGGVLGVLPGIIGTIQATEALKIVLGIGETLHRRLLLFDALSMNISTINFPHNPHCALCGSEPGITELQDYEAFCNTAQSTEKSAFSQEETDLSPHEIAAMQESILFVDVREAQEREVRMIPGTVHIPLAALPEALTELSKQEKPIVFHCHSGKRSRAAVDLCRKNGIAAKHLAGGILAWEKFFFDAQFMSDLRAGLK